MSSFSRPSRPIQPAEISTDIPRVLRNAIGRLSFTIHTRTGRLGARCRMCTNCANEMKVTINDKTYNASLFYYLVGSTRVVGYYAFLDFDSVTCNNCGVSDDHGSIFEVYVDQIIQPDRGKQFKVGDRVVVLGEVGTVTSIASAPPEQVIYHVTGDNGRIRQFVGWKLIKEGEYNG